MSRELSVVSVACLILACTVLPVIADSSTPSNGYLEMSNKFFELVKSGKSNEAVDYIFGTSPWLQKVQDQVQGVKTQFGGLEGLVGKYVDNKLLVEKTVGGRYAYLYYFAAYDRQPIKVEFEFYRSADRWVLLNFAFNADIVGDLKQAAKGDLQNAFD